MKCSKVSRRAVGGSSGLEDGRGRVLRGRFGSPKGSRKVEEGFLGVEVRVQKVQGGPLGGSLRFEDDRRRVLRGRFGDPKGSRMVEEWFLGVEVRRAVGGSLEVV